MSQNLAEPSEISKIKQTILKKNTRIIMLLSFYLHKSYKHDTLVIIYPKNDQQLLLILHESQALMVKDCSNKCILVVI